MAAVSNILWHFIRGRAVPLSQTQLQSVGMISLFGKSRREDQSHPHYNFPKPHWHPDILLQGRSERQEPQHVSTGCPSCGHLGTEGHGSGALGWGMGSLLVACRQSSISLCLSWSPGRCPTGILGPGKLVQLWAVKCCIHGSDLRMRKSIIPIPPLLGR